MKHIDVSRTIHNNLDAEQERCIDDYWNIDGLREWEKNWRISAWNLTNVRNKKEVIHEARTKGVKVHFAPLMDTSHLKKCWLGDKAPKIQRSSCIPRWYCERWFLILCSIHWTRISSVSRMTAGKVMDIISRLPGCAWTSSRRSICLHPGNNGRCSNITENSEIGMSRHLDSSTTTNGPNHGPVWETQSFRLNEISTAILWQDCYGKGKLRKSFCNTFGRRFPIGNAYSYTVKKGLFLSVSVDAIKLAGENQNTDPMWKVHNKEVDLGDRTSFLDHVFLWCTQRQCEIGTDIVDNHRAMFESRISAGRTEQLPYSENFRISSWSYDMEGHAN